MRENPIDDALGIANTNPGYITTQNPPSGAATQIPTTANANVVTSSYVKVSQIPAVSNVTPPLITTDEDDQDEDYRKTREGFAHILEKGKEALDDLKNLAEDATSVRDAARAYEVMSGMIKSLSDATERMYDIHEKKKELRGTKAAPVTNNIDKAVFVGTTEDLVRQIKDAKTS